MKCMNFKEDELFLISSLDYSQESSVIVASKEEGLLIEGGKNSGKKQTIVNIISNSLYLGKKILVVSKDDNSLKDIYERLNYIQDNILYLDTDNYRIDNFYKRTNEKIQNLCKNTGKTTLSKINVLSRDIDKKVKMLCSINSLFNTTRSCGLSLLEMYSNTGQRITSADSIYEYYKIFSIRKPFTNYKYEDLKECVDKLLNDDIVDNYVKYKRFRNNKLFNTIIENIPNYELTNVIDKINLLINNPTLLEIPIFKSNYTEDIIKEFLTNRYLDENEINLVASKINEKYNSNIIKDLNTIKRWNPTYWIKRKNIAKTKKENLQKYLDKELEIINELNDSFIKIGNYVEYFDFMRSIIRTEEYNKFLQILLTTDECVDYLKNLKNTMSIYEVLNKITKQIIDLNEMDTEVLAYCYDNIEIKDQMRTLISNLPKIFLFNTIEEIETSEKEVLHYYKNFEILLKEIQLSIDTKTSFIPLAIKYIWDNKISEKLLLENDKVISMIDNISSNYKQLPLQDLLDVASDLVTSIYPCFIANYKEIDKVLPNIEDCFDVIIFYGGNNLYMDEINKDIFNSKSKIIITDSSEYNTNSIASYYSQIYPCSKLEYTYDGDKSNMSIYNTYQSYMQKELFETFIKLGYKIKLNVNISGYIFDIVVYSSDYKNIILIIECDDIYNVMEYNSRKTELSARRYLENSELNSIKVWSRDWWLNKKTEIKKIQRILSDYKSDKR